MGDDPSSDSEARRLLATTGCRAAPRAPIIARVGDGGSSEAERLLVEILVGAACDESTSHWLRSTLTAVAASPDPRSVAAPYAAASRRLRSLTAVPTPRQSEALERAALGALGPRGAVAMFRGAVLLVACRCADEAARAGLVDRVFRTADSAERVALLAVLPALPNAPAYVETAIEACRSNVRDVFEAIACENDYPARHFSDAAFNQMVMKAVFSGVSLSRVRGLAGRVNTELERMARDYSAERRAAGREVPADLARLIAGQGDT